MALLLLQWAQVQADAPSCGQPQPPLFEELE